METITTWHKQALAVVGIWFLTIWIMRLHESVYRFVMNSVRIEWYIGALLDPPAQLLRKISSQAPCLAIRLFIRSTLNMFVSLSRTSLGMKAFLQEIANHAAAIEQDVVNDPWNTFYSHDYSSELSSTAAQWYSPGIPLLAVLRARVDDVLSQLDALNAGNYSTAPVEAEEVCVDWRGDDLVPDSCYNNCEYDGCYEPSWTVTGACDLITGICYHGQLDENCEGIPNGETYAGIEQREGEEVFCQEMVALSACLPAEVTPGETTSGPPTTPTESPAMGGEAPSGPTTTPTEGADLVTSGDSSPGMFLSIGGSILLVICVLV